MARRKDNMNNFIVYKEHRQLLKTIEILSIAIQLPLKAT